MTQFSLALFCEPPAGRILNTSNQEVFDVTVEVDCYRHEWQFIKKKKKSCCQVLGFNKMLLKK